ncbi:MAG: 4-phosphopantetheinyl transferase [Arthrobacter pascens]|nr:4-phosphopantetheinyl transferase [Arthrobacter pascens]
MPSGVVFRASPVRPADESLLDPAELARAAAMEPAARRTFLAGRITQREFAAELLGVPARELTCCYSCPRCGSGPELSHGRPGYSRAGVRLPLLLSLSRAGGWTLVAAVTSPHPGSRLGVDIEDPWRTDFSGFEAVALTGPERLAVSGLRNGALLNERARLWARKEAWLKMTGDGLLVPPATVDTLRCPEVSDVSAVTAGLPAGLVAAVAVC